MAIINCPECGKEVSDKAKNCVHCGRVLIEDVQPKKFCAECGNEISTDFQECPFCGCPVEPEKTENPTVAKKTRKFIKPLIVVAIVAVVATITIVNLVSSNLNKDEQLAYQNAVELKSMMKDPDSFKLYDEMFLLKHFDENGDNDFTYTVFEYGGTNSFGAVTTDEAIFRDGEYIMDYADEPDEEDSNYIDQLLVELHIAEYALTGDNDTWQMVEIDVEKIKDKMELE